VILDKFSPGHRVFLASISQEREPLIYAEAEKNHKWREAMKDEIQALQNNKTWIVTDLPPGKKALGCKWIYKIKHKSLIQKKKEEKSINLMGA
jgi:hypothetical protein